MSSPLVVVDGKEYRFLAVTTVLNQRGDTPIEAHYVHAVDVKTGKLCSFNAEEVEKIHKMS
jgi:hypothetical protein